MKSKVETIQPRDTFKHAVAGAGGIVAGIGVATIVVPFILFMILTFSCVICDIATSAVSTTQQVAK